MLPVVRNHFLLQQFEQLRGTCAEHTDFLGRRPISAFEISYSIYIHSATLEIQGKKGINKFI